VQVEELVGVFGLGEVVVERDVEGADRFGAGDEVGPVVGLAAFVVALVLPGGEGPVELDRIVERGGGVLGEEPGEAGASRMPWAVTGTSSRSASNQGARPSGGMRRTRLRPPSQGKAVPSSVPSRHWAAIERQSSWVSVK
jgi:hypothetical protein